MTRLAPSVLTGIAASPGYAIAKAHRVRNETYIPERETAADPGEQKERFRNAIRQSREELEMIRQETEQRLGSAKAEIFEGHLLLLEDPELVDAVLEKITEEGVQAEYALYEVAQMFIDTFSAMDDELLRARAIDISDITGRVMSHLRGVPYASLSSITEECIIISDDLTPSDTAQLNLDKVKGFITEAGSRTSHSAIMARSMDIPAIVGGGAAVSEVPSGALIIMDAVEGKIIVNPGEEELNSYQAKKQQYDQRREELRKLKKQPSVTKDGHRIELAANIGSIEDVQKVLDSGAEGIGLFRTEFLYMGKSAFPTEEEQFQIYRYVLEKMNGKPVVIRTLDIGGDKELSYMELPKESNPFLGQRALRLCLKRQDMFRTQLRALLRASTYGNLKIMFPMISVLEELLEAKKLLQEEKEKLLQEGLTCSDQIEVGMMIEVPAAAIASTIFAKEVDFFSIGTNDLIQYSMAADRMNESVSYLYQPCHPAILQLVNMVIRAAEKEGKWVGMCGEMAGDETAIPLLLGLGLHEFSMGASSILPSRGLLRELSRAEWSVVAEQALGMRSQQEVQDLVRSHRLG